MNQHSENSFEADKWPMSSFIKKMYMSLSLTLCDVVTNSGFSVSIHSNRIAECILLCCIHRPIFLIFYVTIMLSQTPYKHLLDYMILIQHFIEIPQDISTGIFSVKTRTTNKIQFRVCKYHKLWGPYSRTNWYQQIYLRKAYFRMACSKRQNEVWFPSWKIIGK